MVRTFRVDAPPLIKAPGTVFTRKSLLRAGAPARCPPVITVHQQLFVIEHGFAEQFDLLHLVIRRCCEDMEWNPTLSNASRRSASENFGSTLTDFCWSNFGAASSVVLIAWLLRVFGSASSRVTSPQRSQTK